MIKVNDEVKQLARALADWAADKSVTVFLFGSRVRGDHRPDSDVDVFVQFGAMTEGTAYGGQSRTRRISPASKLGCQAR